MSHRAGPGDGRRPPALAVIALFRLSKALVLLAVAVGAVRLLDRETAGRVQAWLSAIPFIERHPAMEQAAATITRASPGHLELAASVALAYGALFAVEGVGLWLQRVWRST